MVSQTIVTTAVDASEVSPELFRQMPKLQVVEVHDGGQLVGALISAHELEHFRALRRREIEVFQAGEFPDDVVAALEDSQGKYGIGLE
jgi:hypothetical protein